MEEKDKNKVFFIFVLIFWKLRLHEKMLCIMHGSDVEVPRIFIDIYLF